MTAHSKYKMTWNHAFTLGFAVTGSTTDDGKEITAQQFRAAIMKALRNLSDDELLENLSAPFDTYEEE